MAVGACKLIGKMVVKVNLVGSQSPGSRLAQVARARSAPPTLGSEIRGRQELQWGETLRNRSSFACVCVRVFSKCAGVPTRVG